MEPIGAIKTQIVDFLSTAGASGVEVGLNDGPVLAEELKVDFVLGFVSFEGGEVDVEVEAGGVAGGAADYGGEGAVEEAGGGAPPRAAMAVVGEGDGVGGGAVGAGFGIVVDGDLFEGVGEVERWRLRRR